MFSSKGEQKYDEEESEYVDHWLQKHLPRLRTVLDIARQKLQQLTISRNDRADATGKPSSIKVGDRLWRLRYFARTTPSTDCVPLGGENSVSPTSCAGKYANHTAIVRDREPGRDVQHY